VKFPSSYLFLFPVNFCGSTFNTHTRTYTKIKNCVCVCVSGGVCVKFDKVDLIFKRVNWLPRGNLSCCHAYKRLQSNITKIQCCFSRIVAVH